jgi:hypothetical protein
MLLGVEAVAGRSGAIRERARAYAPERLVDDLAFDVTVWRKST